MVGLVSSELLKLGDKNWLLDGFPRTQYQAEELQKVSPINVVINLDVPVRLLSRPFKDHQ